jgi:transposase
MPPDWGWLHCAPSRCDAGAAMGGPDASLASADRSRPSRDRRTRRRYHGAAPACRVKRHGPAPLATLFVDFAGRAGEVVDAGTGEIIPVQIFVAVLGASSFTCAEASWTQRLPEGIGSHVHALAFMGGVPAQLVPDNPKVGVTRANWYEPGLNRTYLDLATHYGTAILPARPRRPRDKIP